MAKVIVNNFRETWLRTEGDQVRIMLEERTLGLRLPTGEARARAAARKQPVVYCSVYGAQHRA